MITSKLTSKAQTTIPQSIRTALQLREGDEIAYSIEGATVVIRKAPAPVVDVTERRDVPGGRSVLLV